MSKIDYQKLREIAEKTKIAGEAPVMPFDQRINALNDFMKHFSPDIALALLDERERNLQYIKSRDQENEDIALTVGKLRVELETAKKRIAELEAEPVSQTCKLNKLSGNSPVTPDGWISCSERMPDDGQWCVVNTEYWYYVQCWSKGQGWLGDDISIPECDVINWIPLPEPPQEVNRG
ncbi:ead/Ea22-like family protein [Escherichia coli]|uniref:ead/Ea22-like family protein n=1 Tax=Escherichia coli TaxID=562 RepID=UPI001C5D80A0